MAAALDVRVSERIEGIASAWAPLAAQVDYIFDVGWLRALEEDGFETRYLVVQREGRPVGIAACYVERAEGRPIPAGYNLPLLLTKRFAVEGDPAPSTLSAPALRPALICGPIRGGPTALAIASDLPADDRRAVLRALVGAVRGIADEIGAVLVAFPYLPVDSIGELRDAIPEETLAFFGVGEHVIDLPGSFDEWLAGFPSNRRTNMRSEIRKFEQRGLTVDVRPFSECADEVRRLSTLNFVKYSGSWSEESTRAAASFVDAHARLPPSTTFGFLARDREGVNVAACLTLRWAGVDNGRALGVDDTRAEAAFAYFNIGYYAPIRHAIAGGSRRLRLVHGADQAKLLRGSRVRPLSILLWPRGVGRSVWGADERAFLRRNSVQRLRSLGEAIERFGREPGQRERDLHAALAFHDV